jgi:hypothetical protein
MILVINSVLISTCSSQPFVTTPTKDTTTTEDITYLTPIPESTLAAYDWQAPIENKLQAVVAGLAKLGTTRLQYASTPKVISVEKISLEEAHRRTDQIGVIENEIRPAAMLVWLVVFEGEYQIIPPDPEHTITPPSPAHGCSFVIMDPNDPSGSEIGTMDCPP